MSRIQARFASLQAERRKALILFVTAGDPDPAFTVPLMHGLVEAGADILEVGVPFSDPMADGPVIQRASERALAKGVSLRDVLDMVRRFRARDTATPVVLMGYANPIESMGEGRFIAEAGEAGVDGLIVVDYPPEECGEFAALAKRHGLDPIFLLAPTSTAGRVAEVARLGSGFVYYVSLKGVTGSGHLDVDEVLARLPGIRAATQLPIGVGFGIRDAASARRISRGADAVVIASRLIQELEGAPDEQLVERARTFVRPIREALDA
ncbi:MAG: tryptophan synthase subunit alpha [Betaproteobacteria bacterium RIFCSPLOWO2_02_FULL_66_14]|nr:MAG: tryptophan synthase subunit alpha [Betaproteobacteria bacterium RIFCSPLOWO2_02_FULL_66_14]